MTAELTEREKSILRYVIHQFILTANPVGSRYISKKYNIGYSPATIRNIMSDLEEIGYLGHPHTSAGRIPTDRGYRFYVDSLMEPPALRSAEKNFIKKSLDAISIETDELLKITSTILSDITKQLACVTYPKFDKAILEKLQLVSIPGNRVLVVLTIRSGMVKTITLEFNSTIARKHLQSIQHLLNERLSGLKFSEIRKSFRERIRDYKSDYKPIIRVFLDSVDEIFTDLKVSEKAIITGAKNIIKHPEFEDQEHFQSIIELIEDKDVIIHIMDDHLKLHRDGVTITIGSENKDEKLNDFSLVVKEYQMGQITGSVGIVGPKRMEYSKTVAAVIYVAELLSKAIQKNN